jgi:hypothetical protein
MITRLAVAGYRSLRDVVLGLGQLTLITGGSLHEIALTKRLGETQIEDQDAPRWVWPKP